MPHLLTPFLDQVAGHPEAPALLTGRGRRARCVSFEALSQLAATLTRQAPLSMLRPGDTVLVLVPLSIELYALLIALFWLGAVPVLVDPGQGLEVLRHAIHTTQPRAFVGSGKAHLLRLLCPTAFGSIPHHAYLGGWVPGSAPLCTRLGTDSEGLPVPRAVPLEAPALITFTSGSTGLPKAIVRTHGVLLAQLAAIQTHFDLHPGECDLMTLPVFALANLASGVASVLPDCSLKRPARVDAATLLAQCQQHHVTRVTASPALLRQLCREAARQDRPLPFTKIFTGGAPVFPKFLGTLQDAAPRAAITSVYGSTEAEPIAHQAFAALTPEDWDAMAGGRGLLSGEPVQEIDLKLLRLDAPNTVAEAVTAEALAAWEAAAGDVGEVIVSGAHVVPGYLHGRGEEGTKIRVGGTVGRVTVWHRTGDVGWLDDRGRLWLLGRRQGVIQDDRGLCFPFAVSCALQHHPAIAACTTVGVGEQRVLVVEAVRGVTPPTVAEVRALVPWAQVDRVIVVKRLPMDRRHNAKVDYPALWRLIGSTWAKNKPS